MRPPTHPAPPLGSARKWHKAMVAGIDALGHGEYLPILSNFGGAAIYKRSAVGVRPAYTLNAKP